MTVSNGMIARSLDKKQVPSYGAGDVNFEYVDDMAAINNHPGITDVQNTGTRKNRNIQGDGGGRQGRASKGKKS